MIVVSSGGVGGTNSTTQTGSKTITVAGQTGQAGNNTKTVTLTTKPGQPGATTLLNTGSGQIIALPTQGLIQSGHQVCKLFFVAIFSLFIMIYYRFFIFIHFIQFFTIFRLLLLEENL